MRASRILAEAEAALAEGDLPRARALVDAVLAQKPHHAGARELRHAIDELAPFHDPAEPDVHTQEFGDLRPDTRHEHAAAPQAPAGSGSAAAVPPLVYDPRAERPIGVGILAVLDVILGASMMLIGALAGGPIGLFALLLGLIILAAGVGLWRLRAWAWTLSLVASALSCVLNVVEGLQGNGRSMFLGLVQAGVVAYLWVVREHFGPRPAPRTSLSRTRA